MNDFEIVLDECLGQIASGASSVDECLARHPEHAVQLKPLLQTAARFDAARDVKPSLVFKARARTQLTNYMQAHPRRQSRTASPLWRVAISLAVLAAAFLVTGTAFAQGALPGQPLYAWKLSSENVWRAIAPNPVAVDLALANRRVAEMTAVEGNAAGESQAQKGYLEVLARLKSESDTQNQILILQTLQSHQKKLSGAGISIPDLNQLLSPSGSNSVAPGSSPAKPAKTPQPGPILPPPAQTVMPDLPPQALTAMPKGISTPQIPPPAP